MTRRTGQKNVQWLNLPSIVALMLLWVMLRSSLTTDMLYHENDMVYLSTKNLALSKGQARKLMPRFLGPYKVLKAMNDSSNVTLELPPDEEFALGIDPKSLHATVLMQMVYNAVVQHSRGFLKHMVISVTEREE